MTMMSSNILIIVVSKKNRFGDSDKGKSCMLDESSL